MQLIFLGTSAGSPTLARNVTSVAIQFSQQKNKIWLFDCGEATQQQMLKAKLSLAKIERIFITHLHGDHLFGLPGLLASRSLVQNAAPLTVYGPLGIKRFIETALQVSCSYLNYLLHIVEIPQPIVLFDDGQLTVRCDLLQHRIACFGYRIQEYPSTPTLNIAKLQAEQIPFGPHYGELKRGNTIRLENATTICGKDYWSEVNVGRKVTILGDTLPCQAAIDLAYDVDILVHEATLMHDLVDKAQSKGHSTTLQAAEIALQSRAKQLIVTHISPRYSSNDSQRMVAECQNVFANTMMATDFLQVKVAKLKYLEKD